MIEQLDIFLKNSPGQLMKVTKWLAKKKIQIRAHAVGLVGDFVVLKAIVNDPKKALKYLQKKNFMVSSVQVFCVGIEDKPGELHKIATLLGESQINIKYIYGFVLNNNQSIQVVQVEEEQYDLTKKVFQKHELNLFKAKEIYKFTLPDGCV